MQLRKDLSPPPLGLRDMFYSFCSQVVFIVEALRWEPSAHLFIQRDVPGPGPGPSTDPTHLAN